MDGLRLRRVACASAHTNPNYNRDSAEKRRQNSCEARRQRPERVQRTEFELKKYMCLICGWIYDEAEGAPEEGIAPGTRWEDVPPNWTCPECGARKEDFEMIEI
jgi:rubredoxin